jgi:SAM-dependent methyltransferase
MSKVESFPERALAVATAPLVRWLVKKGQFPEIWYPKLRAGLRGGQLAYVFNCLDEIAEVEGVVLEIGCAFGHSTALMGEYMQDRGIDKPIYCIDTFAGFTDDDVAQERRRGKQFDYSKSVYQKNNIEVFRTELERLGVVPHITKADICNVEVTDLPQIAFCLLDVDLYQPVAKGLRLIWEKLSPGGLIVVDDCAAANPRFTADADRFDGALQAYAEFIAEKGLSSDIREGQLGTIRKPR